MIVPFAKSVKNCHKYRIFHLFNTDKMTFLPSAAIPTDFQNNITSSTPFVSLSYLFRLTVPAF
jgi:hypothetical protein